MNYTDELDNNINLVFINLKILSNIKEYDKLIILEDGSVQIEGYGISTKIRRWWNNRSRQDTLDFLKEFVNETFKIIDKTLDNETMISNNNLLNNNNLVTQQRYFIESNHHILQKFLLELRNAIRGLQNLKITYNDDISFKSRLDVLIEEIEFRIEKIGQALRISISDASQTVKQGSNNTPSQILPAPGIITESSLNFFNMA